MSGKVGCYDQERFIRFLCTGDSFGEQALYKNGVRGLSVIAEEHTECISIARDVLEGIFGQTLQEIVYRNRFKWSVESNLHLRVFDHLQKYQIFNLLKFYDF